VQNYQHQLQIVNKESLEQQLLQDYHGLGGMNGFNLEPLMIAGMNITSLKQRTQN
jgi:hypothetical protein